MIDTAALTAAVETLQAYCEQVRLVMNARGYPGASVSAEPKVHSAGRPYFVIWTHYGVDINGDGAEMFTGSDAFARALTHAGSLPTPSGLADDFAATIGITPDGRLLDPIGALRALRNNWTTHNPIMCDDCDERPATETWDYSDAPIPNPPAPDHFCELCADRRRDHAAESAMEG